MISIGLADDQQLVRAGFRMVLNSQEDMRVLWDVGDGQDAVAHAAAQPVDIILMDIQMPNLNGIAATEQILQSDSTTRIIALTTFDNDEYVLGSLRAGASGFLLKDAEPEDLLQAVRTVARGEAVIAPKSTARLLHHLRPQLAPTPPAESTTTPTDPTFGLVDPLTAKELEVTKLVALGYSNTQIAAELFVSMSTVKTHISHILAKTGAPDRVHIVLFAFRNGIVSAPDLLGHTPV